MNTLQYAIDFAQEVKAKIYLVHVFSSSKIAGSFVNVDDILARDSKEILKEHLSKVDVKDVEIITSTLKGHSVIDTLKQIIKLVPIDLIIASTKNDAADESIFIGSITGRIIKDTEVPVLAKIQETFNSKISLLQVKTPKFDAADLEINETLQSMVDRYIQTRNATVFQGVLEFWHDEDPDMLCVIRRKRGFFKKLWQEDRVKKIDFDSNIPLLVLKGMS